MKKMIHSTDFQNIPEEEVFSVNGGAAVPIPIPIPIPIVVALIGAAVTIGIAAANADMENAVERGRNDAYNDINNRQNGTNGEVIYL